MSDPEDPWSVSLDTTFRIKLCKVWNKDSALGWLTRATMSSIDPTWIADQLQDRWTWDQVLNLKKKHKIYAPEELNSSKGKGKFTKIQIEELVRRYYKPESVGLINRPSYVQLAEYSMSEWDVKTQPATLSKLMKEYKPDVEQKETQ